MKELLKQKLNQQMRAAFGPYVEKAIDAIGVTKEENEKLKRNFDIILSFILGIEFAVTIYAFLK